MKNNIKLNRNEWSLYTWVLAHLVRCPMWLYHERLQWHASCWWWLWKLDTLLARDLGLGWIWCWGWVYKHHLLNWYIEKILVAGAMSAACVICFCQRLSAFLQVCSTLSNILKIINTLWYQLWCTIDCIKKTFAKERESQIVIEVQTEDYL